LSCLFGGRDCDGAKGALIGELEGNSTRPTE
jgi:hypothetical protein